MRAVVMCVCLCVSQHGACLHEHGDCIGLVAHVGDVDGHGEQLAWIALPCAWVCHAHVIAYSKCNTKVIAKAV